MKASELIEELQKQIEEHGDKEVHYNHYDCEGSWLYGTEPVTEVTWDNADDVDDVIVLW